MNTRDYIDLRIEQLKLKGTDTASQALGTLLAWILIIAIALMVLTVLAFGGILLLGKALGNYALGAFIVGGGLLLVLLVLWIYRKKMFRGTFIRLLSDERDVRELERAQELNAVRLMDAESSDTLGLGKFGIQALRILIRALARK
jgi:membrane-anchored glycerophosphoryl diester phosphodiesterase (GDPDase)